MEDSERRKKRQQDREIQRREMERREREKRERERRSQAGFCQFSEQRQSRRKCRFVRADRMNEVNIPLSLRHVNTRG